MGLILIIGTLAVLVLFAAALLVISNEYADKSPCLPAGPNDHLYYANCMSRAIVKAYSPPEKPEPEIKLLPPPKSN